MIIFSALGGCLGEAALIHAILILFQLSKKLGEVTKMRPFYRAYYVSIVFLTMALVARIVNASQLLSPATRLQTWEQDYWMLSPLPHNILLAIGLTVALFVTAKYWGWLVKE